MAEEKTPTDSQQTKTASKEQPAWTMPLPEMIARMMACCGCRPEKMGMMWTTCCGRQAERKEDPQTA